MTRRWSDLLCSHYQRSNPQQLQQLILPTDTAHISNDSSVLLMDLLVRSLALLILNKLAASRLQHYIPHTFPSVASLFCQDLDQTIRISSLLSLDADATSKHSSENISGGGFSISITDNTSPRIELDLDASSSTVTMYRS
jgi:hypothetical protein